MDDLIKALQIFAKYTQDRNSTHCEHDVLQIHNIWKDNVSDEDLAELERLSFHYNDDEDYFYSFRFGSC